MLLKTESITLKKTSFLKLLLSLIFLTFFEKFFMPEGLPTGTYNAMFGLIAFLILSMVFVISFENNIDIKIIILLFTIVILLSIHFMLFSGDNTEMLRYILASCLFIFSTKVPLPNMVIVSKVFVIVAGALLIINFGTIIRFTGFINTSPTVFSLIMLSASTILIFNSKSKIDWLIALLSIYMLYLTGSRSTLIVLIILITYKVFRKLNLPLKILTVLVMIPAIILLSNNVFTSEGQFRQDGEQSTETREFLIQNTLNSLNDNPITYLTGNGAGAIYQKYNSFPVHFDPLVILYDFGIIGLILMLVTPVILLGINVYSLSFLLLGSFHNLIYFPVGIVFFVFTIRALSKDNHSKRSADLNVERNQK